MGTKASVWEASMVAACTTSRTAVALQDSILELDDDREPLSSSVGLRDRPLRWRPAPSALVHARPGPV